MKYDLILIDVFNLYYRRKSHVAIQSTVAITNNLIDYIENELKPMLSTDGKLFLLFDPIAKDDLTVDSSFKYSTERKQLNAKYKENRKKDGLILQCVDTLRRYFLHQGPNVIECENYKYEADDYVESIVKEFSDKKILMVTTDEDWSRFLSENVHMMNRGPKDLFTVKEFQEKYKFKPTIASVTYFKALYGDGSDNIQGALFQRKKKVLEPLKLYGFEFIKHIGETGEDLKTIEERTAKYNFKKLHELEDMNPEEKFFYEVESLGYKLPIKESIQMNLRLIKTICEDYKKVAVSKEIDDKFTNIIKRSLNRPVDGEKKGFKFKLMK